MTEEATEAPLIVALGEAMIRLTTRSRTSLSRAVELDVEVAGTELDLLIAANALGARSRWLSRLPDNELGTMIRRHVASFDIEVRAITEPAGRAGLFFMEFGVPPRPSTVLYDRRDSAASHLCVEDFDWRDELVDAKAAHTSGVTCALGDGPLEAVLAFFRAAKDLGVVTSFDMNYRSQLWDLDQARVAFQQVLPFVDVLFLAPSDLETLTGLDDETEVLANKVREEYDVTTMVLRDRREVSTDELGAIVRVVGDDSSEVFAFGKVVDEIGAGDVAAGAFLAAMLGGEGNVVAAQRCARAYARMLTIPGDTWSGSLHDLTDGYVTSRKVIR
ncbi:MAG: sugar kinase [Acidimicrobiales bacterium]